MNTTYELSHLIENSIESKTLLEDIKEWIDSNMHMSDQCSVWNIGITTSERLVQVTGKVRSDFVCKHFKYWNTGAFRNAIGILTDLNKHSFVFKSALNTYTGKGRYIFVYKTPCKTKNLFYHTLHH